MASLVYLEVNQMNLDPPCWNSIKDADKNNRTIKWTFSGWKEWGILPWKKPITTRKDRF